jgi:MerR family transcriptional regulator/heat shock protein HspR
MLHTGAMEKRTGSWDQRLEDPTEPLYAIAVVADLLNVDAQVLRRYESAGIASAERNGGNQRRFSRNDIAALAHAIEMTNDGISVNAVARILELERQVAELQERPAPRGDASDHPKRRARKH